MPLSTEIFVLCVFLIGLPLFGVGVNTSRIPGHRYFIGAYFFLLLSNLFTVIEELCCNEFFNALEHASLAASAVIAYFAVSRLVAVSCSPPPEVLDQDNQP